MSSLRDQECQGLKEGAMSRTYQYRKVMKPLLERKRRARINRCLEELKNLLKEMTYMDAEALAKLEKADILELTVHQLHRQRNIAATPISSPAPQNHRVANERYWSGFQQCTLEVSRFLHRNDCLINSRFLEGMEQFVPSKRRVWRPW